MQKDLENEYTQVMAGRTDDELVKIVSVDREGYKPEAIVAAEAEIKKRQIHPAKFRELVEESSLEKEQTILVNSNKASKGSRLLNFILDSFFYVLFFSFSSAIAGIAVGFDNETPAYFGLVIWLVTFFIYYVVFEAKFQKTLAKFITKTHVVYEDNSKPSTSDILLRTLFRLIPFDAFSFLFVERGFHDYLSRTTVVKDHQSTN